MEQDKCFYEFVSLAITLLQRHKRRSLGHMLSNAVHELLEISFGVFYRRLSAKYLSRHQSNSILRVFFLIGAPHRIRDSLSAFKVMLFSLRHFVILIRKRGKCG